MLSVAVKVVHSWCKIHAQRKSTNGLYKFASNEVCKYWNLAV